MFLVDSYHDIILDPVLAKILSVKGGGTLFMDKIPKVVFDVLPKSIHGNCREPFLYVANMNLRFSPFWYIYSNNLGQKSRDRGKAGLSCDDYELQ